MGYNISMNEALIQWFLSACLVINLYLMGNKTIWGPITGVGAQLAWIGYILLTHQYGLLSGSLVLIAINLRNWVKWHKDMQLTRATACDQCLSSVQS